MSQSLIKTRTVYTKQCPYVAYKFNHSMPAAPPHQSLSLTRTKTPEFALLVVTLTTLSKMRYWFRWASYRFEIQLVNARRCLSDTACNAWIPVWLWDLRYTCVQMQAYTVQTCGGSKSIQGWRGGWCVCGGVGGGWRSPFYHSLYERMSSHIEY